MNYFIHMLLYLLRLEEYFSVITCTFYIIDCLQGLGFLLCNFYILRLEINHFGPKSILLLQIGNKVFCSVGVKGHWFALRITDFSYLYGPPLHLIACDLFGCRKRQTHHKEKGYCGHLAGTSGYKVGYKSATKLQREEGCRLALRKKWCRQK